jgi:hypothetical protein
MMAHVSRPLIALLIATVVLLALWLVALKPGGSGTGGSSNQGLSHYQADINAAHHAVTTANAASAAAGASAAPGSPAAAAPTHTATAPVKRAASTATVKPPAGARPSVKPAAGARSAASRLTAVQRALHLHKVVALLFLNPAAPDDWAVGQELARVSSHGGKVFKLAVPLSEIGRYAAITNQVPVNFSPTLVLVAPNGQANEIVGYADPFEISQRVEDALAIHP